MPSFRHIFGMPSFRSAVYPTYICYQIATPEFATYIMDPKNLDKLIRAELHHDCSQLYEKVVKYMLHGPCGKRNPNRICCYKVGVCRQHFLKEFVNETNTNVNSYPQYRRRNNENDKFTTTSGQGLDNRWVVPYYTPYFLRWDGHGNFELCATVKSCKYTYTYVLKGHDNN